MARAGLLPSSLALQSPGEWHGDRACPFPVREQRSLAASPVRAGGNAEARAAGRGSSPGCEQIPLILWPFREPAYSSRCSRATFPSDLTCSGPRAVAAGRSLPGERILRGVSAERDASVPLNG